MLADGVAFGHRSDHRLAEILRMRARETDPLDPLDGIAGAQQRAELGAEIRCQITTPGVDVLAEQRDFAHPVVREAGHLGDDVPGATALLASAHRWHDAVGARGVAAHRNLHPGVCGPLAVLGQMTREMVVGAEPGTRNALASHADPVTEVWDRTGPERHVDLRVQVENAVLLSFGEAAADRDHEVGVLPLPGPGVAEVRRELRVGLLANGAGVEDDDVGIVLRGSLAKAERFEHPLDALGIVAVHLAAEGGQVVTAHVRSVGVRAQFVRYHVRPGVELVPVNPLRRQGVRGAGAPSSSRPAADVRAQAVVVAGRTLSLAERSRVDPSLVTVRWIVSPG